MNFTRELRTVLRMAKDGAKQSEISEALKKKKDERKEAISYAMTNGLIRLEEGKSSGGRIPTLVKITSKGRVELDSIVEKANGSLIWGGDW